MANPLSIIPATEITTELLPNPKIAALTDDEKLRLVNSSQDEVCGIYKQNNRLNYVTDNSAAAIIPTPTTAKAIRVGRVSGVTKGQVIVFQEGDMPTGFYTLRIDATIIQEGESQAVQCGYLADDGTDSRTVHGFTAYPTVDGVDIEYTAIQYA